ncbi:MAG: hypothetical protein ACOX05_01690 [Bacillota bacterium]|jgi:transposase
MTIEIALLIALLSFLVSLYFNIGNAKRSSKAADQKEATALTTIAVRLESISADVQEIKTTIKQIGEENKYIRDRVIMVEQTAKSAHRRLNEMIQ